MKVLFVTTKSLGGAGKHLTALVQGLPPTVHSTLAYGRSGVLQDQQLEAGVDMVHLLPQSSTALGTFFKRLFFLFQLLRREHFDVVHTHTSWGGLLGRLAAWLAPGRHSVVHTLHAYAADQYTPRLRRSAYWLVEKLLDSVTDAYVAPSRFTANYGRSIHLFTASKARMIYNALPLTVPTNVEATRNAMRKRLGISAGEVVFLFCGRLEEQKGADVLIKALRCMESSNRYRVLICGDGAMGRTLKTLAVSEGVSDLLIWLGWQDDVSDAFVAADIFVMPSRWESFGLAFLEAMNYGLPILSTRTQAVPEVVEHDANGLLCASEDAVALASNMQRLLDSPSDCRRLGENGRNRLAEHFTYVNFLDGHMQLYCELIGSTTYDMAGGARHPYFIRQPQIAASVQSGLPARQQP